MLLTIAPTNKTRPNRVIRLPVPFFERYSFEAMRWRFYYNDMHLRTVAMYIITYVCVYKYLSPTG